MMNKAVLTAYAEASKYWHLACNWERVNPENANISFRDINPHKLNYQKASQKLQVSLEALPKTENPCL